MSYAWQNLNKGPCFGTQTCNGVPHSTYYQTNNALYQSFLTSSEPVYKTYTFYFRIPNKHKSLNDCETTDPQPTLYPDTRCIPPPRSVHTFAILLFSNRSVLQRTSKNGSNKTSCPRCSKPLLASVSLVTLSIKSSSFSLSL